jgi:hypothetical protein
MLEQFRLVRRHAVLGIISAIALSIAKPLPPAPASRACSLASLSLMPMTIASKFALISSASATLPFENMYGTVTALDRT